MVKIGMHHCSYKMKHLHLYIFWTIDDDTVLQTPGYFYEYCNIKLYVSVHELKLLMILGTSRISLVNFWP